MNLQLSLKRNWFEMTKSGEKTEDYREVTARWCNRFLLLAGRSIPIKRWEYYVDFGYKDQNRNIKNISQISTFKDFSQNTMTLGYPTKGDTERTLILEHKGIEIRTGNPDWGAEEGKLYFVIKHGSIIN